MEVCELFADSSAMKCQNVQSSEVRQSPRLSNPYRFGFWGLNRGSGGLRFGLEVWQTSQNLFDMKKLKDLGISMKNF